MTYFEDAQHAAETADKERTGRIVDWLDLCDIRPHTDFFTVIDDAIYAEDQAKVHGVYPPLGHSYPRTGHL